MAYLRENFELDLMEITRFSQRHQSDFEISNLTHEQLDAYEQMQSTAMVLQINNEKIYIAEVKSETSIRQFSSIVQKYLEDKNLPILFAIGEFDGSVVIIGRSTHLVVNIGGVLSLFEAGGGHATAGKKKIIFIFNLKI